MAPIDGIRFVHAAICNEARDIELQAHSAATPEEAGALLDRLEFYAELIDGHTRGEELGLFPPLVQRSPHIADTYLLDHDDERGSWPRSSSSRANAGAATLQPSSASGARPSR